jgi:Zn-dependent M28 family amino/carboxypeptidase
MVKNIKPGIGDLYLKLTQQFKIIERNLIGDLWQENTIHDTMRFLADEVGSRFAGTPSETRAQEYILDQFHAYGYPDAKAQEFTYFGWHRGTVALEMLTPKPRLLSAIALALSPGGEIEGEVVNMGTGSPEEFHAKQSSDLQDRIVLCSSATSPAGERVHRRTKYAYAVDRGAKGFIFMNHNPGKLSPTGSLRPAHRMGGEIPGIGVSLETGSLMLRLANNHPFTVRIRDSSQVIPNQVSRNLIADLPGKGQATEWIVVGGHYDGHDIAQGAMDNLSAIAVIMEVAKHLQKYKQQFRRNIRFIAFGCEELGVTGSTRYVEQHLNQLKHIALMINLELGGLAYSKGTQHVAFTIHQPPQLMTALKRFSNEIQYPLHLEEKITTASDHWPFYLQGIPAISMHAEPSIERQIVGRGWGHTTADTMDKVDLRNLQEGVMILARLIVRLANDKRKLGDHTAIPNVLQCLTASGMKSILEMQRQWPSH